MSIPIKYDGVEYDLESAINTASNDTLIRLKRGSRYVGDGSIANPEFAGVTIPAIKKFFNWLGDKIQAESQAQAALDEALALKGAKKATPERIAELEAALAAVAFEQDDLLGDDNFLLIVPGIVWLCREAAGEAPDIADINKIKLILFELAGSAEDDDDEDPKALTGPVEDSAPEQ